MSLADDAKLLLIPTGYKTSKVYSVFPTDGDGDFDYTRSSDASRVNPGGLIETVGTNIPRIDHFGGGCPTLLLEPQRTNDTTYSQDFTQTSYWNNVIDVVATKNEAIAPDGTLTANKIQANSGTNFKILRKGAFTIPSGITMSMFVKRGNHDYITFKAQGDYSFNLSTLEWRFNYPNVGYELYPNGWIRLYATTTSSSLNYFGIYLLDSGYNQSWNATGNEFVYVWGGQYETGSYPTSYIKTEGSTVTRLKDKCLNGGDANLFNITEGTFFVDSYVYNSGNQTTIGLSNGTDSNKLILIFQSYGTQVRVFSSGGVSSFLNLTFNQRNKIAVTFKENEYKFFINGALVGSDTSATVPTGMDRLNFSNRTNTANHFQGKIHDTRVYDRVLTQTEAETLTTL